MNTDKSSTHQHAVQGKPTTNTGVHSHSLAAVDAAIAALDARLDKLEAQMGDVILRITKLEAPPVTPPAPPPVEPPPTPPPPTPPPNLTRINVAAGGKGVTITANNQVIENLEIVGPGCASYGSTFGIYGSGSYSGVVIRNCVIRKLDNSGIWLAGLSNVTVEDCTIEDVTYSGIMTVGVTGGTIQRNAIHRVGVTGHQADSNAYGIAISGITSRSSDIVVTGNTVDTVPLWHGLDTHGGLRITFSRNTVRHTPRAIFLTAQSGGFLATEVSVTENLFTDPAPTTGGGTNPLWATTYDTRDCSFTDNRIGTAYNAYGGLTVYDYMNLSTGLTQSGNINGESLP